jgi:hypothetical protein
LTMKLKTQRNWVSTKTGEDPSVEVGERSGERGRVREAKRPPSALTS